MYKRQDIYFERPNHKVVGKIKGPDIIIDNLWDYFLLFKSLEERPILKRKMIEPKKKWIGYEHEKHPSFEFSIREGIYEVFLGVGLFNSHRRNYVLAHESLEDSIIEELKKEYSSQHSGFISPDDYYLFKISPKRIKIDKPSILNFKIHPPSEKVNLELKIVLRDFIDILRRLAPSHYSLNYEVSVKKLSTIFDTTKEELLKKEFSDEGVFYKNDSWKKIPYFLEHFSLDPGIYEIKVKGKCERESKGMMDEYSTYEIIFQDRFEIFPELIKLEINPCVSP